MNYTNNCEQEIDLRRLAGYLLRNIKTILIWTLVVLVVAGTSVSYKTYSSRVKEAEKLRNEELKEETDKAGATDAQKALEAESKNQQALEDYEYAYGNAVEARDMAVADYDKQVDLLEESYINNLDYTNVYSMKMLVKAEFKDVSFDNSDKYSSAFLNSELKNLEFKLNSNDFRLCIADIIGVSGEKKLAYVGEVYSAGMDINLSAITVLAYVGSTEERTAIESAVKKLISGYKVDNPDIVINITDEDLFEGYNASVYNTQQQNLTTLATLKAGIVTKNAAIASLKNAEEKRLADKKKLDEEEAKKAPVNLSISLKKIVLKSFVIALFIGLFISCGYFTSIYILCGKIHGIDEVSNMYKVRYIGDLASGTDSKSNGKLAVKNLKFIKFIEWIEGIPKKYDSETAKEIVKTNIKNHLGDAKRIVVVTSLEDERLVDVQVLIDEVKAENYVKVNIINFKIDKLSALKQLAKCDKAIIVEKSEVSKIKDISEEIYQIRDLNKEIIGVVGC